LSLTKVAELLGYLAANLAVSILRNTNSAQFGDAFEPSCNVHAVAHQVAVALLHDISEVDADAKLDAAFGRQTGIALDHAILHLDGAADRIHHAAELDDGSVAGAFDHASVVHGNGGGDEIAPERPQPCQRTFLVAAREAAEADHVRGQDSGKLSLFSHGGVTLRFCGLTKAYGDGGE
jgi:hypothetical protein